MVVGRETRAASARELSGNHVLGARSRPSREPAEVIGARWLTFVAVPLSPCVRLVEAIEASHEICYSPISHANVTGATAQSPATINAVLKQARLPKAF